MTEFRVPLDGDDGNAQNNPWMMDETSDSTAAEAYADGLLTHVSPGFIDFKLPAAGDTDPGGTSALTGNRPVLPSGPTAVAATTAGAVLTSSAVVTRNAIALTPPTNIDQPVEAPIASSGAGGATTESYGAAGGLVFDVTYDASVNSAPAGFTAAFAAAVEFYTTKFSDPITINIDVGWGEVDGIPLSAGDLGESDWSFNRFSYSQVRSALQGGATSADDREAVATLPASDPTGGGNFWITTAEQKALGLLGASTAVDGYVGFSANDIFTFDPSNRDVSGAYDFIGVAEHEISEVMGRDSFSGRTISGRSHSYSPMDLFRYASPGTRQLGTGAASYFSIDGGTTDLGNWNNFVTGNSGDLGDWAGTTPYTPDAYNDNNDPGVVNPVTQSDIRLLNVIGWDLAPSQPPIAYDFNGDKTSDILWQNTNGQAAVWLMNGTTPISGPVVGNPGPSWQVIGAGDFNGDGDADILWQNTDGQAAVWLMNGTTPISEVAVGANPGPSWQVVGAGDFNGDGDADILWQNTDGQAAIWLMYGTTPISEPAVGANPGPSWHIVGTGDFNGDGDADILWQNTDGQAAIWLMNGTTPLSGPVIGNPGPSWHVVGVGDFNGDGDADILWQNTDGQAAIWLMNGATPISEPVIGNPGPSWHIVGTGDYDGDGKSDILWQNDNGQASIWLMNGTTPTAEVLVGSNPGPSWHIHAAS